MYSDGSEPFSFKLALTTTADRTSCSRRSAKATGDTFVTLDVNRDFIIDITPGRGISKKLQAMRDLQDCQTPLTYDVQADQFKASTDIAQIPIRLVRPFQVSTTGEDPKSSAATASVSAIWSVKGKYVRDLMTRAADSDQPASGADLSLHFIDSKVSHYPPLSQALAVSNLTYRTTMSMTDYVSSSTSS